jgi:hypothetical protein
MHAVVVVRILSVCIVVCGQAVIIFVVFTIGIVYTSLKPTDVYVIVWGRDKKLCIKACVCIVAVE